MHPPVSAGGCFLFPGVVDGVDAVSEFVWQGWFRVTAEEFRFDDFAELREPVAQRSDVARFDVVDVLEFVARFDEFVYLFVLRVDLFLEFPLRFDEVLVGGGEVAASRGGPCDSAAYYYSGESHDGRYQFGHVFKFIVECFLICWIA